MTQTQKILRYMTDVGSITTMDAIREFSCTRLAARIGDLRKAGYKISKVTERSRNRYGEPVNYARYKLENESGSA